MIFFSSTSRVLVWSRSRPVCFNLFMYGSILQRIFVERFSWKTNRSFSILFKRTFRVIFVSSRFDLCLLISCSSSFCLVILEELTINPRIVPSRTIGPTQVSKWWDVLNNSDQRSVWFLPVAGILQRPFDVTPGEQCANWNPAFCSGKIREANGLYTERPPAGRSA